MSEGMWTWCPSCGTVPPGHRHLPDDLDAIAPPSVSSDAPTCCSEAVDDAIDNLVHEHGADEALKYLSVALAELRTDAESITVTPTGPCACERAGDEGHWIGCPKDAETVRRNAGYDEHKKDPQHTYPSQCCFNAGWKAGRGAPVHHKADDEGGHPFETHSSQTMATERYLEDLELLLHVRTILDNSSNSDILHLVRSTVERLLELSTKGVRNVHSVRNIKAGS